jgi:hypothetical protein
LHSRLHAHSVIDRDRRSRLTIGRDLFIRLGLWKECATPIGRDIGRDIFIRLASKWGPEWQACPNKGDHETCGNLAIEMAKGTNVDAQVLPHVPKMHVHSKGTVRLRQKTAGQARLHGGINEHA